MAPAEREAWLDRCDAEHDNFRAAIEYLIESASAEWGLRLGARHVLVLGVARAPDGRAPDTRGAARICRKRIL
jgi:hypothetical protein